MAECVWLTDWKDGDSVRSLGGSHLTKLITGFVRLDKWIWGFEETDASIQNTDEDRAGAKTMVALVFSKTSLS